MGYNETILAEPSLLYYWKLGQDGLDSKGSAIDMTYFAGAQRSVLGRLADDPYATGFDRSANCWAKATPPGRQAPYTTEAIVYIPAGVITNGWYIYGTRHSGQLYSELVIDPANNVSLRGLLGVGGSYTAIGPVGSNISRPAWHHVALTVALSGAWVIYLDGVSIGSGTANANPWLFGSSFNGLAIGTYDATAYDAGWAMVGKIQSFAVYTSVLSAAAAAAHYAAMGAIAVPLGFPPSAGPACPQSGGREYATPIGGGGGGGGGERPLVGQLWPR